MRTGAIFARGSCRALKWMALVGMVFALGAGQALAQQPTSIVTDTMANDYSRKIAVVTYGVPVWGDVPPSAFVVGSNTAVRIMGLPAASPGANSFAIVFSNDLVPGTSTLTYTSASLAADLRLKTRDNNNDGDPDDVADVSAAAMAEENNAPVFVPTIADVAVMSGKAYTDADPAYTLPQVKTNSGAGALTYTITGLPDGLTVPPANLTPPATGSPNANFGKITGTTTADGAVAIVTWTATDSATTAISPAPSSDNDSGMSGRFRLLVQSVPGMPGGLTAEAGDGSVILRWTAPTGAAVTHYEYSQDEGDWMRITGGGSVTMHEVTGLTNGQAYAFRVRAVNVAGAGAAAGPVPVTPSAAVEVPGKPLNLEAHASSGQVELRWTVPATGGAVASYEYKVDNGAWMPMAAGTIEVTTDKMYFRVRGLTNGTTYVFQVRAVNAAGAGEASDIARATPQAGPARGIRSVSLGTINEGGQAQATVSLSPGQYRRASS